MLFLSTRANKIDSEQTQGYKRLPPVCEAEILRVTLKRIEVFPIFTDKIIAQFIHTVLSYFSYTPNFVEIR